MEIIIGASCHDILIDLERCNSIILESGSVLLTIIAYYLDSAYAAIRPTCFQLLILTAFKKPVLKINKVYLLKVVY